MKGVKDATVFTKGDVNGPNTRPTYRYLKDTGVLGDIAWNFAGKFIVDKEGNGNDTFSALRLSSDLLFMFSTTSEK